MTFHDCPLCKAPAQVLDRWTLESTDGPVEHVKVRCALEHWFAMPTWMLDQELSSEAAAHPGEVGGGRSRHARAGTD